MLNLTKRFGEVSCLRSSFRNECSCYDIVTIFAIDFLVKMHRKSTDFADQEEGLIVYVNGV